MVRPAGRRNRCWKFEFGIITSKQRVEGRCTFHSLFRCAYLSEVYHPPVEMVMIGAPSLLPVSVRVMTNIRNEKSFLDR